MFEIYSFFIPIFLLLATLLSAWLYPIAAPVLGMVVLVISLAISIRSIFEEHKQAKNSHPKITKDILVLILTLLLIVFLGGLAGMFANYYASLRFGAVVGFVTAIAASFVVGYFVKKGVGKLGRG